MKRTVPVESASALIDEKIKELGDWRGKTLAKVRDIIHEADPEIVEEWKWAKADIAWNSRLFPRRHRLHGRDVQERRQDDICQGSCVEGPFRSIQLQPRRQCQARHRHPRRRQNRRGGLEGSHPRSSGAQSQGQEQAEAPASEQQAGPLAALQFPAPTEGYLTSVRNRFGDLLLVFLHLLR